MAWRSKNSQRYSTLGMLAAGAVLFASCGGGTQLTTGSANSSPELQATCGNLVFDSLPPDLSSFEPLDDRARAALDELINGPTGVEAQEFATFDMLIAEQSSNSLTLAADVGSSRLATARFEERGGALRPTSWGGCQIQVQADGFGGAATILNPDIAPDPASTTLNVWIQERDCASGQPPSDRQVIPVVNETEDRIEINTLVEPVRGDAECPGNPFFPVEIELDSPIGDRAVFDMFEPPGTERAWPPTSQDLDE